MDQHIYDLLIQRIRTRIDRARRVQTRIMLLVHSLVGVGGVSLFVSAFRSFSSSSVSSGFIGYLSLLFSDSATVLSNWSDFVLSILESAPLDEMALLFGGLLITFISAQAIFTAVRRTTLIEVYRV